MPVGPQRLVIVRRGETALYESLAEQFRKDPETQVLWDRRVVDRRHGERRFPDSGAALAERGFFVTRATWTARKSDNPGDAPR